MTLHIIKLCVGADSPDDLDDFIARRMAEAGTDHTWHQTRMMPKRREEVLDGGSIYWVFKGQIGARQAFRDIVGFTDEAGVSRCRFILDPVLSRTRRLPRKAFQGWRYFDPKDAPPDILAQEDEDGLPPDLSDELYAMGIV